MKNKKILLISTLAATLFAGSIAYAGDNDLLRMDIKPSSAQDSVDVTFYTTGSSTSSVVTRKSDNRYIVLLPNVSGNSSVVPNLGGVKNLITDIDVKSINDGIGGYTKVTFNTVKPLKIQTSVKHTEPLTKAQQDYKNLIAQNNAAQTAKKPVQTAPAKTTAQPKEQPAVVKTNSQAAKTTTPVQNKNTKPAAAPVVNTKTTAVKPAAKTAVIPTVNLDKKPVSLSQTKQVQEKIINLNNTNNSKVSNAKTQNSVQNDYKPKMKFENGKRVVNLEPHVSHETSSNKPLEQTPQSEPQVKVADNATAAVTNSVPEKSPVSEKNSVPKKSSHNWLMILGCGILGLMGFAGLKNAIKNASSDSKISEKLSLNFNNMSYNSNEENIEELQEVADSDDLNWQEKYKKYVEQNESKSDMSKKLYPFISKAESVDADTFANVQKSLNKPKTFKDLAKKSIQPMIKTISVNKKETSPQDINSVISSLEHSLAQTPVSLSEPDFAQVFVSEDNKIANAISKVKLTSFAKPKSMKSTNRNILGLERKILDDSDIKEGKFVQLDKSILNISSRKSKSSVLNAKGVFDVQKGYFNNGGIEMKKQDDYSVSSLNEYLSILDTERSNSSNSNRAIAGMSNPISSAKNSGGLKLANNMLDGMSIKSGFNIDSEKCIYLVTIDGVSAIVGKNNTGTYVLKKFDHIIDASLQVRHDYDNVYIVKAGGFKCLVDVANEKMGTLLEI